MLLLSTADHILIKNSGSLQVHSSVAVIFKLVIVYYLLYKCWLSWWGMQGWHADSGDNSVHCAGHYICHFLHTYYHWIKAFKMQGKPLLGMASFDTGCRTILKKWLAILHWFLYRQYRHRRANEKSRTGFLGYLHNKFLKDDQLCDLGVVSGHSMRWSYISPKMKHWQVFVEPDWDIRITDRSNAHPPGLRVADHNSL